jgi:hypothetical protein
LFPKILKILVEGVLFFGAVTSECAIRDLHAGNIENQEVIFNSHGEKIDADFLGHS